MMYEVEAGHSAARLEDYVRAVRARLPLVIAAIIIASLIGNWYANGRTETFTARAAVGLGPTPVGSTSQNNLQAPRVERESELLASSTIASAVVEQLGLDRRPGELLADLEVKFVPNSDVLQLAFTDESAAQAAAIASAFVELYVNERETAAEDYWQAQVAFLQDQLDEVDAEIALVQQQIDALTNRRAEVLAEPPSDARTAALADIDADQGTLRSNQNQLFGQLRTTTNNVNEALQRLETRQPTASVVRTADLPSSPNGLPSGLVVAAAGLLGLIFGVAAAFLLERLDTTARDEDSVKLALGARVIGEVPNFGYANRSGSASLVMISESSSGKIQRAKESFRRLRSSLQFLRPEDADTASFAVAFTSAFPGEGKSTVAANTAIALAQGGKRVVLLSADLRRPALEGLFGTSSDTGLSEFLSSTNEEVTIVETGVEGLWLIPSGTPAANSSELLGSKRFGQLLELLREDLDFVIMDTPPALSTADTVSVAQHADGVIVVIDSRATSTPDLLQVRSELERSGASILGSVLNRDRRRRGSLFRRDRYVYHA